MVKLKNNVLIGRVYLLFKKGITFYLFQEKKLYLRMVALYTMNKEFIHRM